MPKRSACASLVLACVLVALTPAPGQAPLLVRVRPTVFVVSEEREERQVLTVTVGRAAMSVGDSVEVVVTDGNRDWRAPVKPSAVCDVTVRVLVPRRARRAGRRARAGPAVGRSARLQPAQRDVHARGAHPRALSQSPSGGGLSRTRRDGRDAERPAGPRLGPLPGAGEQRDSLSGD